VLSVNDIIGEQKTERHKLKSVWGISEKMAANGITVEYIPVPNRDILWHRDRGNS